MPSINKDLAYVLHSKPYRDNSALVYLLTQQNGRLTCVVNGLKSKQANKRAYLQPCRQLQVSYQIKPGLSKLTTIDSGKATQPPAISSFMLYQYTHELLLSLLPEQLPIPTVFQAYEKCLAQLSLHPQTALRALEMVLIEHFSGLPELSLTQDSQQAVDRESVYYFYPNEGIYTQPQPYAGKPFNGAHLQAFNYLAKYGFEACNEALAQGAQPVSSYLIQQLLNHKPLKTRAIYKALQSYHGESSQ